MPVEIISWQEFQERLRTRPCRVVDLRSRQQYRDGHVPGAISCPFEAWESGRNLLPKEWQSPGKGEESRIYCYCERGNAALAVARQLASQGCLAGAVMGGYRKNEKNP